MLSAATVFQDMITGKGAIIIKEVIIIIMAITAIIAMVMLRVDMNMEDTGIIPFFPGPLYLFLSAAILIIMAMVCFIVIIMAFMSRCMRRLAFA